MGTKTIEVPDKSWTASGPMPRVKITVPKAPWET